MVMTTPAERLRAIVYARDFLLALLDPKQTPRVPKEIRIRAYDRLRHYPSKLEIEQIPTGRVKKFFGKVR